ncbi:hypothetical protein VUR80DRAFT_1843 [Thermomyces stellatus]
MPTRQKHKHAGGTNYCYCYCNVRRAYRGHRTRDPAQPRQRPNNYEGSRPRQHPGRLGAGQRPASSRVRGKQARKARGNGAPGQKARLVTKATEKLKKEGGWMGKAATPREQMRRRMPLTWASRGLRPSKTAVSHGLLVPLAKGLRLAAAMTNARMFSGYPAIS